MQVRSVTGPAATGTTAFAYDADGQRLIRQTPAETTLTVGISDLVYPAGGGTATGRRTLTLGKTPVAVRSSASSGAVSLAYISADDQSSTDISLDSSTQALTRTRYTPYGKIRATTGGPGSLGTGLPTDEGFLGKTYDVSTGLNALGARYYQAGTGVFTAPDPIIDPQNPRLSSPYTYAAGNPIAFSDPTGLRITGCDCPSSQDPASGWYQDNTGNWKAPPPPPPPSPPQPPSSGTPGKKPANLPSGSGIPNRSAGSVQQCQLLDCSTLTTAQPDGTTWKDDWNTLKDLLGVSDAQDCFGQGSLAGCAWTATILLGFLLKPLKAVRLAEDAAEETRVTEAANAAGKACANSFTGDTPVLMADGTTKPIKDVKIGDKVLATDPQTGERGPRSVTALIRHSGQHIMVAVTLADGSLINATDQHPFWVVNRRTWVDAIRLVAGDMVQSADGRQFKVITIDVQRKDLTAYNLTISGLHTYFAGADSVLVHNSGCDEWAAAFAKRAGGEVKSFRPNQGKFLGPYRPGGPGTTEVRERWFHHTVVVRDGSVYDQWHPNGVGIDSYKQMFDYHDAIDFGF